MNSGPEPFDRDLLDKLPVGLIVIKDFIPIFANKKYREDLRISNGDKMTLESFLSFIHPDEHERMINIITSSNYDLPEASDWKAFTYDGEPTWIQLRVGRLDERHHVVIIRNIGAYKKILNQVSITEAQYQSLVEKTPNFIFIFKNGKIDYYNQAFIEKLGYTREEIETKKSMPTFIVAPEYRKKVGQFLIESKREHIQGKFPKINKEGYIQLPDVTTELELLAKDGSRVPVHAIVRRVYTEKDSIVQGVLVDLSSLKKLQNMKFDFLTLSQHHLRTPLSNMKGYLDFYKKKIESNISEEEKETLELKLIEVFTRNINRMVTLTEELNDIALIRQGRLKCSLRGEDFIPILQRTIEDIEFLLQQYRVHLIVEYPKTPLIVNLDRNRITQALRNVLENAIRFTGHGTVEISLKTDPQNHNLVLIIKDSGIGISKNNLSQIGQPFATFHSSQSGLGLGLYLTKQIIQDHSGKLEIDSKGFNKGTSVTITLPLLVEPEDLTKQEISGLDLELDNLIKQATSNENMLSRMEAVQKLSNLGIGDNLDKVLSALEHVILYDRDRTIRNLASQFYSNLLSRKEGQEKGES
ncbi:MAG: PAS domain-containing sensor histidine kinase [Candidatus Hodarchaeales archaeon]